MQTADVAIIGAGVVGLSTAYELALSGMRNISVLERERRPGMGTTAACTGGIRLQFSSPANIEFSRYGLEHFSSFDRELEADIGFSQNGYLFLITAESDLPMYEAGRRSQASRGVETQLVERDWIEDIAPFLSTGDVLAGSFCAQEGHADPHGVVQAYLRALRRYGIRVRTDTEVTGIQLEGNRVTGVATPHGSLAAGAVVNSAGPFASRVCRLAGLDLSVTPRKRHVMAIKPAVELEPNLPLIVDGRSGWYLKAEPGGIALMGGTDRDGSVSLETSVEPDVLDGIIAAAVERAPGFAEAGLIETIVGTRSLSPDDHALIGPIPGVNGFYCAAGFSGHGFMHAPAAGKALAELITTGRSHTFDLTAFDPGRFDKGCPGSCAERYVF